MSQLSDCGFIWGLGIFAFVLATPVAAGDVVINEFVANSGNEWVELYNASDSAGYLKSYFIDDDTSFTDDGGSKIKSLATLNIANPKYPFIILSSAMFNNDGDIVVLFDPAGNIVDQYTYSVLTEKDVSIGRYPDKTGNFFTLSALTQGDANEAPVPTVTPTPTVTPKPSSTPTAAPVATATQEPTPEIIETEEEIPTELPTAEVISDILGEEIVSPSGEKVVEVGSSAAKPGVSPFVISFSLVGCGLALLSAGLALQKTDVWKKFLEQKNQSSS